MTQTVAGFQSLWRQTYQYSYTGTGINLPVTGTCTEVQAYQYSYTGTVTVCQVEDFAIVYLLVSGCFRFLPQP